MTKMMTIIILTSLIVAGLDIEAAVRQDKDLTVMIILLNKGANF